MLRRVLASSRYIMLIPVIGTFVGSLALMVYEGLVLIDAIVRVIREGTVSPEATKSFAVGLVETVDVFLIAIALYIVSVGLYALFIDDTLPLPRWLGVHDLEDLKGNLISVVIAVLAVLFLREAVLWETGRDLPAFGTALALVIAALTLFLTMYAGRKRRPGA
jgi:uncharacterized membrane protein YqhA